MSASSGRQNPPMSASKIGFLMALQLRPGQLLGEFLERADAAGQSDESVGAFEHHALALMHVLDDDELLHVEQRVFALDQKSGDNPGDLPAAGEHRARDAAHQAVVAAAEHEPEPGRGHRGAEFGRRLRRNAASLPSFEPQ